MTTPLFAPTKHVKLKTELLNSLIKYIKNQFYTCLIVVNCDMCFHFAVLGLLV